MKIFNTYSKRNSNVPDVFLYDNFTDKLKTQIFHIWNDFFSQLEISRSEAKSAIGFIYKIVCREEGLKYLYTGGLYTNENPEYQIERYFEELTDTDKILNFIEITFTIILHFKSGDDQLRFSTKNAVSNLNTRFKENGFGYEFVDGKIIRIDNKLLHSEIIQSALVFLLNEGFSNANEEYLRAHEHFRHGRNHECLNDCLKSFESTMKIICNMNGWEFKETDTAKVLINVLLSNEFFPKYHDNYLVSLKQLLESNIPTIRNKNSAHGQGIEVKIIPNSLASYMLYSTGATINLLVGTQFDRNQKG